MSVGLAHDDEVVVRTRRRRARDVPAEMRVVGAGNVDEFTVFIETDLRDRVACRGRGRAMGWPAAPVCEWRCRNVANWLPQCHTTPG